MIVLKLLLGLLLMGGMFMLSGCGRGEEEAVDMPTMRVAALRGPTALGMLYMMDNHNQGETRGDYTFELVGAPVEIAPLLVRGEVDFAAVPGNLAAVLYNQTGGDVQAIAVVTLGVLHILDATGEVFSVEDLRGRTIFATGEGATPEFALNYVLTQNGLIPDVDVFIEFRAEPPEIAALFDLGEAEIALLPEPFATTVTNRFEHVRHALDLTEEWNRVQPEYGLIMSVVVGRREFLENYPEAVAVFMAEYAQSIAFMTGNIPAAAQLSVDFEIIPNVNVAQQALPRTHMVFLNGDTMKRNLMGFYRVLYNESPAAVGGALPNEDFFFIP